MSVQGRKGVETLIQSWTGLSYTYSLKPGCNENEYCAIFSKPTPKEPCPKAVVHATFYLEKDQVQRYRIENERHVYDLSHDIVFNEAILDRVIRNKLKWTQSYDLHDEFTRTRIPEPVAEAEVSEKTKADEGHVDPMEDLEPKTATDVENSLIQQFIEADKTNKGYLTYDEFRDLLLAARLSITEKDIKVLFDQADENQDGYIEYREFVPVAVELVHGLNDIRDQLMDNDPERQNLFKIFKVELAETVQVLRELLDAADYTPPHRKDNSRVGQLSNSMFRRCLTSPLVGLSKEEVNMMVSLAPRADSEHVFYKDYEQLLYEVKYRIYRGHKIGLNNGLREYLLHFFQDLEKEIGEKSHPGKLKRFDIINALQQQCSKLMLTTYQIYSIMGNAAEDSAGYVDYHAFVEVATAQLQEFLDPNYVKTKAELINRADIQPTELLNGRDREAVENAMMEQFKEYDMDENSVLDLVEFRACLSTGKLIQLSDNEIQQLICIADSNGDGVIDYGEFSSMCYLHLLRMAREKALRSRAKS